ncbi:flagellar basal-body rod protein FlgF [Sneathiella chinensis]|uniref:Flagellar basal-body rod protein FlgF n=1 Tax=Sneathiella chinensis TaxID=349750 RepID=A0ABQ5U6S2_9PROT|nr:flagellar basal-body rod protein FlgF [Sneathiella chinensis]GLQ07400.1 flagellar basal-body rod protein FlgF [Sneathiella chinensis]
MENAVYIGLSQQVALRRQLDIVANNLANQNTTGFKGSQPLFEEFLIKEQTAHTKMSYVQDFGLYTDVRQGVIQNTGRTLDVAINGDGYFTIETDAGLRYTRNGNFKLDPDGNIVTTAGDLLVDEDGQPIQVNLEFKELEIAPDGTITTAPGQTQKLEMITFENQQNLKAVGNGYYNAGDEAPLPTQDARLLQGSLEKSNVNPILEMTSMIEVMRSYQAAQKLLDAEHDLQMKSIEELPAIQ